MLWLDSPAKAGSNLARGITFVIGIITNVIGLNRSITFVNLFADRLRYIRAERGMSQAALARACGLSQSAIANYENGSRKAAKDIFGLAEALDVSPVWLALGDGPIEALPKVMSPVYRVTDAAPGHILAPWPFPDTPPDVYWSLSDRERAVVQTTLSSLIRSLKEKRPRP
ncbi:helix-turn-helix domain-containing protein [Pollutimonas nitritireducens]